MQKILLTRSVDENEILSRELLELGFEPISAPMIVYKILPYDFSLFQNATDIIITSKFAAKIIADNYPYNVNCYIVGEESANITKRNIHINIEYIADTADELKEYCKAKFAGVSSASKIIYFSGNIITVPFEYADKHVIYEVEYTDRLEKNVITAIENEVNYILLYSKNCAANLIKLLKQYNLLQNIQNSVVIALSSRVASEYERYASCVLFPHRPKAVEIIKLLIDYGKGNQRKSGGG